MKTALLQITSSEDPAANLAMLQERIAEARIQPRVLQSRISLMKNRLVDPDAFLASAGDDGRVLVPALPSGVPSAFNQESRTIPFTGSQSASIVGNDRRGYRNGWVRMRCEPDSPCVWTKGVTDFECPSRHGEGKLIFESDETFVAHELQLIDQVFPGVVSEHPEVRRILELEAPVGGSRRAGRTCDGRFP